MPQQGRIVLRGWIHELAFGRFCPFCIGSSMFMRIRTLFLQNGSDFEEKDTKTAPRSSQKAANQPKLVTSLPP
jgi:hypothetical protein